MAKQFSRQADRPRALRRGLMLYGSTAAMAGALMLGEGGAGPAIAQEIGPRIVPTEAAQGNFIVPGPAPSPSFEYRSGTLDIINMNRDAVLNWTTYDTAPPGGANGNSYVNFLPAGTELRFVGNGQSFTAINRVFTTPDNARNYRGIAIQGQVTSYLFGDGPGSVGPVGGNIWFFSPGGILATGSASFNVGSLLLSASDLDNFVEYGNARQIDFSGVADPFAAVILKPGARVTLTQPNSSFAIVAPTIEQGGDVTVDGSVSYVSGEQGNLYFYASGEIGAGIFQDSQPGNEIRHLGATTGPASIGTDDFMVFDPQTIEFRSGRDVRVLLSGSIGYAPADSAALQPNGSIVLTAGTVSSEGDLTFTSDTAIVADAVDLHAGAGDLISMGGDANGNYALRVETPDGRLSAGAGGVIDIAGDVLLASPFQRGDLQLSAAGRDGNNPGGRIEVGDNLTLDASVGLRNSASQQGGNAEGTIGDGGSIIVGGNLTLTGDAYATADDDGTTSAIGGRAVLTMIGSDASLSVGQSLTLSAQARPFFENCECFPPGGGFATGGYAALTATGGTIEAGSLNVSASAEAFASFYVQDGAILDATGGTALVALGDSTASFSGISVYADARAARSREDTDGGAAFGGTASFSKAAGGSLAAGGLVVSAKATGGLGSAPDGESFPASRGGDAEGGSASIMLAQNAEGLGYLDLDASAQAGAGGSADGYAAESGGDGGDAYGGTATLILSGAGTNLAGVLEGSLSVSANGGHGGDGEADFNNDIRGGDGGSGGTAQGGILSITAADGAEFAWDNSFRLDSFGGNGGSGGNQTSGEGGASGIGAGGAGGDATGATIALTADGGSIAGDLYLDARGEGGSGGLNGLDLDENFTGNAAFGASRGGSITLTARDNGVSRFDIGSGVFDASGDVAGLVAIVDATTALGAGMRFADLAVEATGDPAGATPAVRLSAVSNAVEVDGTAEFYASSIALDFAASGRLDVGGFAFLSTDSGDITITHTDNSGVLSLQSGSAVEIYADGNYQAGVGSAVASADYARIRATGSIFASDTSSFGTVSMFAQGDATVGHVSAGEDFELFAGRLEFDGSYGYQPNARATVTGAVTAGGSVLIESGGFAEFAGGSSVRSDNNIRVRTGDDIIVASGASLISDINPDEFLSMHLLAGDINFGPFSGDLIEPIATPIASLVVAGSLDTNGASLYLSGDAIDATGSSITTRNLYVDVTDVPPFGPFSNDGGLLSTACRQGSACLGSVTADGDVAIGLDSNNGLISLRTGAIDFTGDNFDVVTLERLELNADNVSSNLTANERISLHSVNDTVALAGITLEAPTLSLRAGTDLAAGTATLISPNTITITVGTDLVAGTIVAGGGLDDGSDSGTFSTPGDFIVDSLTYGAGNAMRIDAGGDLSVGFADPIGSDIELSTANALFLGSTAPGSGAIRLEGGSVAFNTLSSSSLVYVTAGGAVAGAAVTAAGSVAIAGTSVVLDNAGFGNGLSVTARSGFLTGSGLYQGTGSVNLQAAQGIAIGSVDALGGIAMTAGAEARFVELRSRDGSVGVTAGADITGSSVAAAGENIAGDDSVSLVAAGAIALNGAVSTLNPVSRAQDDFTARAGGAVAIVRAEAGRDLAITAGAGTLSAANVVSGRDLTLTGPAVQLSAGSVAGNLTVRATGGDITGSGTSTAGGAVDLDASGNIAIGALAANGGNLTADAGGSLAFTDLAAAGSLSLAAGTAISGGSVSASAGATVDTAGAIVLTGLSANNAALRSTGGAVSASGVAVSGLLDAGGTAVTLAAPGALRVEARATAGPVGITAGADLRVNATATGDIALASTGGSVIIGNVGQSGGSGGIGAESVSGGGAVAVTAANAISVADSLAAGGALGMTAGGLVSLNGSATGQTIALRAADLAIGSAGSLGTAATQRISLSSSSPVNLGAGANSGFAIDAGEFSRIQSGGDLLVTALAGIDSGAGSLTVGALTVNAGSGGQLGTSGTLGLAASGLLDVNNTLSITRAGSGNTLMLTGDAVDLDYANAALSVLDNASASTGRIIVNGRLITSLSASAAADIVGKTPAEINTRLGQADVTREIGLFRTGSLTLEGRDAILIQNSGGGIAADARRGLNVGALTVTGAADGSTLVVINGIVNNATGNNAAQNVTVTNAIGAGSSVNGCLLANIAACFAVIEPAPLIVAPVSILFGTSDQIKEVEDNDEVEEGVAEGKTEAPPIDTTRVDDPAGLPMIDDPVTGAGNEDMWQPPDE